MNIDDALKDMREAINFESHITMQINTLLCKCNVCNAIGNLYIFLTIFDNLKAVALCTHGEQFKILDGYLFVNIFGHFKPGLINIYSS